MKKPALPIFILVLLTVTGMLAYYRLHPLRPTVMINGTTFTVELAITPEEITRGLGGRDSLKPLNGMLFIRDHKERYRFWMGNMRFPLDFLWIDGNRIVDITKNVPITKNGEIPQLEPVAPVDKILEINAGETDKAGIKVGDTLLFNK